MIPPHTLHADTTLSRVKRQGSGAYLVAISGLTPLLDSRMNSPTNSSDLPKPYTWGKEDTSQEGW